jgi:hypothetical protein
VKPSFLKNLDRFCALMRISSRFYHANSLNNDISLDISSADVLNVLFSLNQHQVQYLIIDGLAGVFYGHIRTSLSLSFWVKTSSINKAHLADFLKQYKDDGLKLNFLEELHNFRQADFDQCYTRATTGSLDDVPFSLINLCDLIQDKKASIQLQDLADVEALERLKLLNVNIE